MFRRDLIERLGPELSEQFTSSLHVGNLPPGYQPHIPNERIPQSWKIP